jgi:hypothetical protein
VATKDLGGDSGTTAQVGQDGAAHANFPPFDAGTFPSQLVWFAIAFGFLYWYLAKRGLPPRCGRVPNPCGGRDRRACEFTSVELNTELNDSAPCAEWKGTSCPIS